jgi:hypothetical protein
MHVPMASRLSADFGSWRQVNMFHDVIFAVKKSSGIAFDNGIAARTAMIGDDHQQFDKCERLGNSLTGSPDLHNYLSFGSPPSMTVWVLDANVTFQRFAFKNP